jgi:outer membrane phospholipase A
VTAEGCHPGESLLEYDEYAQRISLGFEFSP